MTTDDPRARWMRITELFDAALACPEPERRAFLAKLAAEDADAAREVESLLAAHHGSAEFLDRPAFALAPDLLNEPSLVGRTIGAYHVIDEIGRGGMGVIYRADDVRLGRTVVLKSLLHGVTADPVRRERLRREARAAASLSHPNVATVYALEEYGNEIFMVSEYVRGRTLREELHGGPLPFPALVRSAVSLARALEAAHGAGLVHRDLKPENIMCTEGTVKILDFGLVHFTAVSSATTLTETGAFLGTPAYMAPEQIEGQDVDFRTDHFALGVVLYEAATGVHPFRADTPAAVPAKTLTVEPAPLVADTGPEARFAAIVHRCLRKRPEERFASTTELADALERVFAHASGSQSGTLRQGVARYSPHWWWRAHQVAVTAVYGAVGVAFWRIKDWIAEPVGMVLFLALVLAASLDGALRLHLVFTERFNLAALDAQRRSSGPAIRSADWAIVLIALAASVTLARAHTATAAALVAVAVVLAVTFLLIEPATSAAAFPSEASKTRT